MKLPQRAHTTVSPRKEAQPSSYTHLWNLSGKPGEVVVVPESFVKPNQSTPPATLDPSESEVFRQYPSPSESEAEYETAPPHREEHQILYPKLDPTPVKVAINIGLEGFTGLDLPAQSSSEPSPKTSTRKWDKIEVFDDEPVYVNYQTIDEYVRQESSYCGDTTADISGTVKDQLERLTLT